MAHSVQFQDPFSRLLTVVLGVAKWLSIALVITMTISLFVAVLSRYLFQYSFFWIEAFSRYALVWVTLLGNALALRERKHIGIDNLVTAFPDKWRVFLNRVGALVLLSFSAVMVPYGFKLFNVAKRQTIPELRFPMSYIYIMIPISAILLVLVSIEILIHPGMRTLTSVEGAE